MTVNFLFGKRLEKLRGLCNCGTVRKLVCKTTADHTGKATSIATETAQPLRRDLVVVVSVVKEKSW